MADNTVKINFYSLPSSAAWDKIRSLHNRTGMTKADSISASQSAYFNSLIFSIASLAKPRADTLELWDSFYKWVIRNKTLEGLESVYLTFIMKFLDHNNKNSFRQALTLLDAQYKPQIPGGRISHFLFVDFKNNKLYSLPQKGIDQLFREPHVIKKFSGSSELIKYLKDLSEGEYIPAVSMEFIGNKLKISYDRGAILEPDFEPDVDIDGGDITPDVDIVDADIDPDINDIHAGKPPDMNPDHPPDMQPDHPPDMQPDHPPDMQPDHPPDMQPDHPPDMQPDQPPDIQPMPAPELAALLLALGQILAETFVIISLLTDIVAHEGNVLVAGRIEYDLNNEWQHYFAYGQHNLTTPDISILSKEGDELKIYHEMTIGYISQGGINRTFD